VLGLGLGLGATYGCQALEVGSVCGLYVYILMRVDRKQFNHLNIRTLYI
jgi:hypothetical protein